MMRNLMQSKMTARQRVRLTVFMRKKRAERRKPSSSVLPPENDAYSVSVFGPRHGLTPEQVWQAQRLLNRANARRGRVTGFRYACRIGGIISAVKRGLVDNAAFGHKLLAHRGGRTMKLHAPDHLQRIAPLGVRAAQAARLRRKALQAIAREAQTVAALTPLQRAAYEHWKTVMTGQARSTRVKSWLEF